MEVTSIVHIFVLLTDITHHLKFLQIFKNIYFKCIKQMQIIILEVVGIGDKGIDLMNA